MNAQRMLFFQIYCAHLDNPWHQIVGDICTVPNMESWYPRWADGWKLTKKGEKQKENWVGYQILFLFFPLKKKPARAGWPERLGLVDSVGRFRRYQKYSFRILFQQTNKQISVITPVAGLFLTRLGFEKIFKTP